MSAPLSAVIVHYQTPDLIRRSVGSFRRFYPELPLLVIDNGSTPETAAFLRSLLESHPPAELLLNTTNIHHGPAMDQGMRHLRTPLVLLMDSDAMIINDGLLDRMRPAFDEDPLTYAVGPVTWMDARGFDLPPGAGGHPYVRPICMLLRRELYLSLPPFERHGAPCLRNMIAAVTRQYRLVDFPVQQYIRHEGRGTAARHGYALGLRGRLNHLLHRLGF